MPAQEPYVPYHDTDYPGEGYRPAEWAEDDPACAWMPPTRIQFSDVAAGKVSLDDFMNVLSTEQMVHVLGGQPNRGTANTFGFGNLPYYGIPNVMTADGPAGLRIKPQCGVTTTAFPTASLIACTWDQDLAYEIGRAGAE